MNLPKLKTALARVKTPESVEEVLVRYVDTMGNTQTVPIVDIIEEIPHGESKDQPRRVILVARSSTAP
jgi:hypothetical protein